MTLTKGVSNHQIHYAPRPAKPLPSFTLTRSDLVIQPDIIINPWEPARCSGGAEDHLGEQDILASSYFEDPRHNIHSSVTHLTQNHDHSSF